MTPHSALHYDVIVVGGGPSGSTAAYLMAQSQARVLLIDAQKSRIRKICGEFLCHEGVEILRSIGLASGVENHQFLPGEGAKIVTQAGTIISGSFPQEKKAQPGGYCLDRQQFDAMLMEKAEDAGTELLLGERVKNLTRLHYGWLVETLSGQQFSCDLLVGADGLRSTVGRLLELSLPPRKKRVALRCFLPTRHTNQRRIEMHLLGNGNYIGIDVVGNDFVNFSIVVDHQDLQHYESAEALIRYHYEKYPILQENMILPDLFPKIDAISPVSQRVKSCITDNAVLIGDAGGFIEPLTGEGITISLWTAVAMAQKLIECRKAGQWEKRQQALKAYALYKARHYREKMLFSSLLHWLIAQNTLCDALCKLVKNRPACIESFMGIINNTFSPVQGTLLLLRNLLGAERTPYNPV